MDERRERVAKMGDIRFGTDGWRAVMCDEFTFSNVRRVVQAIADYLREADLAGRGVVVAYDARFLSERFAQEAASVLAENGVNVWITSRDTPTPVAAHAVVQGQRAGAVMFTASHNPPEYNGLKWIPEYGGPAMPDVTTEIEKRISTAEGGGKAGRWADADGERGGVRAATWRYGSVEPFDPMEDYVNHVSRLVDIDAIRRAQLRIVYDPLHGSGRGYLDRILEQCDLLVVNDRRDPLFGGSPPDPSERRLQGLASKVRETGAHLGLATDGDADRFGIIDSDGTFLSPNYVISLLAAHLARNRGMKGVVVRTVATSHMVDAVARASGLEVRETPVGFKYVSSEMRRAKVVIGGEESGGLSIGGHVPEKDGILACLLATELRAVTGRPLRETLNALMHEVGCFHSRRVDLHVDGEGKARIMDALRARRPESVAGVQVLRVSTMDGVKTELADGSWFLVRASGTEPVVRIYVEAPTEERLSVILETVENIVRVGDLEGQAAVRT
ncbi:MAG: phosphoglucomutase/phosphomannomutase family protein [Firmicutes bacterium]|jgi:alpha-D-glucose phosphate-specific phosphoglucomutase|nr:phosphoglucomutase/phosphomannomutase family protein [Bacillota bacterium]MDH7496690.1 phosphoglucomutase/phosphomannomutase family protein [Bacillota bacterium]